MIDKIEKISIEISQLKANNKQELEILRVFFLGKKGKISTLIRDFRSVDGEKKKEIGRKLNLLKENAKNKINELKNEYESKIVDHHSIDLTRTAYPVRTGNRHPISIIQNKICTIFTRLGFSIVESPEIEDDWHVFSALNFAKNHPARDLQDTFFLKKNLNLLLRTHTSSVQVRSMEAMKPPIRIICPGRVYRNEVVSSRSNCFFHQVEVFFIYKDISFVDLKQVLSFFVTEMFEKETKVRFRPSFFPFTEPSLEMDISCNLCVGKGCSFCKYTGWVEILGGGMIDPNVIENCGLDAKTYSGYALGMGVERIANLKYQIKDLRLFFENDIRFLKQF